MTGQSKKLIFQGKAFNAVRRIHHVFLERYEDGRANYWLKKQKKKNTGEPIHVAFIVQMTEIWDKEDSIELTNVKGEIDFENVSFHYDEDPDVLHEVSFHVNAGETIALVGPTGAGKTTIVNLISRFYDVQSGKVLLDGNDLRDVSIDSLRSKLGVMTQDNFLFTGTIKENIRYGRLDATDEEIIEAAKA